MTTSADARAAAEAAAVHRHFLAQAAEISPELMEVIGRLGPRTFPDRAGRPLVEFLARAVVGQQLSTRAARSIWGRVEALADEQGMAIGELLGAGRESSLRACGLSGSKARTLVGIGQAHAAGRLDGERLRSLDHAAIGVELTGLWGVGRWTSDMVALFYCGCPDVWPEQDVTVQKTFQRLIGSRRKPSKWAARFAPHRSWLALYMWATVDALPALPDR